jgi:hypothetical protein
MTFSQEPTSFRLQNGDEIPDTDRCLILVALLWREPSFCAFVGHLLDPPCISVSARRRSSDSALWRSRHLPDSREHALLAALQELGLKGIPGQLPRVRGHLRAEAAQP